MQTATPLAGPVEQSLKVFAPVATSPIDEVRKLHRKTESLQNLLTEAEERIDWLLDGLEVDIGGPNEAVYVVANADDIRDAITSLRNQKNCDIEARVTELTIKRIREESQMNLEGV